MGRPRQDDGEPGAGPEPGYPPPEAQQVPVAAPPAAYPPVNPVVSGYDASQSSAGAAAAAYPPGQREAAPYPPPGPQEPAAYPPPSPYPPPVQFPPSNVETLPPPTPVVQEIGLPWSTGLFDCHEDQTNAVMTAFFPCVTFGQIAEILDNGQTSCALGSLMYLMMAPALCTCSVLGSSYRAKLRQRYNLVQAPAEDWVLHLFCPCCVLCQEFRELRNKGVDPALGYLGNLAKQQAGTTTVPPQAQFMNQ